jgi:hypothetical protein
MIKVYNYALFEAVLAVLKLRGCATANVHHIKPFYMGVIASIISILVEA